LKQSGTVECYRNNSLWIRAPCPILEIKDMDPDVFYKPDVFVWLPNLLEYGLKLTCPNCCSNKNTCIHGWPSKPARRIVAMDRCYYMIAQHMQCKSCKITTMTSNPKVISHLPRYLQLQFPAVLTKQSGLDLLVSNMLCTCFNEAMGPDPFARMLLENHTQ
jgi:hypothetical protein